ncbi:MAG: nucleoside deaminase [Evtepia sp.]
MTHQEFMNEALDLAKEAGAAGEVPVGCVIVQAGAIIGRGRNRREEDKDALGHAELAAIHAACQARGDWRLSDASLYVTLEPCPMCAGAIINARIPKIYYGAKDERLGCCGSVLNLFEEDFKHKPQIVGGILEHDCSGVLKAFFEKLRNIF